MFRAAAVLCLLASSFAARIIRNRRKAQGWTTRTDTKAGACAAHVSKAKLPIYFPLYCSGTATNLKFSAEARGHTSPRLRLSIGSVDKGYRTFPVLPATRTWTVSHDRLNAGLHILRYSGDRLDFKKLVVTGEGASCSLEEVPGYSQYSFTNQGIDVITRVVGPKESNFSDVAKRQLYFAHETLGTNADGTISTSVISDGVYEWMYMYNKDPAPGDEWLSEFHRKGYLYNESQIQPHLKVALDQLPGRSGEDMEVCEPCNSLSNIMFHEAAAWTACQGYPFSSDEMATLMTGLSFTGGGSMFFHASATRAGHLADVYAMDLMMYNIHQIIAKSAVNQAGSALNQADKDTIMFLGKGFPLATEKAKELTTLFRQGYDRDRIWKSLSERPPNYILSIVTIVLTVVESMKGRWPIPGIGALFDTIFNTVLNLLSGGDIDWVKSTYRPAIQKMFRAVSYCGPRDKLVGRMLSFGVTFVEAFVFQEELIPVPDWVRTAVGFLPLLGLSPESTYDMKETWDIYNTQKRFCDNRSPHGQWHEKAAQGLLHISNAASLMVTDVKQGSC